MSGFPDGHRARRADAEPNRAGVRHRDGADSVRLVALVRVYGRRAVLSRLVDGCWDWGLGLGSGCVWVRWAAWLRGVDGLVILTVRVRARE
ncbi:hypothetical protein GCM10023318_50030 [Nocardia callitridis]|uniref:Uncharacterized protein n=1 Tax=Nocardia callitridis TaxID=648753 RepID=A0ABP9KV19_9NOCA